MPCSLSRTAVPIAVLAAFFGCSKARDPPTEQRKSAQSAGPALAGSLDSAIAEGQRLYDGAEYAAARALWIGVLERARSEQNTAAEAQLLTGIGLAAWRLGKYREARSMVERAVALESRHGLLELLPRSYNALGLLAWDQGRLSEAVNLYEQTVAAAVAVGNMEYVYKPAANLGTVHTQLGDFPLARQYLLRALHGARGRRDPRTAGRVLNNLAVLETLVGDPGAALRWLEEARDLAQASGDATGEEAILGQLASAHMALGEPGRAFATADSALRQARAQGLRQAEAANLELQAQLYREGGDLARALELYRRGRTINEELGLGEEVGRDLRSEAEIHFALGDVDPAVPLAERALRMHRDIGARPAELADRFLLAQLAEARGEREATDEHLAAAQTLVRSLNVRSVRVDAALAEARVLDRRRDARRVARVLDAIADDLALSGYTVEWEVRALRARAHARLGELERAADEGRRAVAAVERVRGNFASGLLRTGYVTDKRTAYADLVGVLLKLGRTAEAFEVADAARGRALLEHVRGGAAAGSLRVLSERGEALRRIEQLASSIAEAEDARDAGAVEDLVPRLRAARRDFEASLVAAAEQAGAGAALLGGHRAAVGAVQDALKPEEAVLEYLVADDRLFVLVVMAHAVQSFETKIAAAELQSRIRLARDLAADPGARSDQASGVLAALHDILLGSAGRSGALVSVRRLLIIPHGALAYVPFAALWDRATGRYLIERYSLLYLPAAGALPALRTARTPETRRLRATSPAAVFAPFPGTLPASRAEARVVGSVLRRAEVLLGKRATERAMTLALVRPGLVHVASHAVLNAVSPMFSRVDLARGTGATADDNGRLEVHEVLGLTIGSPLVFLSGCETGLGAAWSTGFVQGEDYATLDRAFLYAGARNVVATLWPVTDRGAAVFAEQFYRRLSALGPVEALAEAQRAMLADPAQRHPYHWAAYRLAGGGEWAAPSQKDVVRSVPP